MPTEMDSKREKCIDDCTKCYQACVETMSYCIDMGGKHVEPKHLILLKDCSEMCRMCESFMLRSSPHAQHLCEECAEICEECAEDCERVDPGDIEMKNCAEMCRTCAESCRAM